MKKLTSFALRTIPRKHLQLVIRWIPTLMAPFYRGSAVECAVCQQQFRKFMPYGRGASARDNVLCPNCLSLERHRLIWNFLKQQTNFFRQPLRMLHVAPELCFMDRFAEQPNLDYVTADLESPLAEVKLDVHDIPFADDTFDVVMCNHVLEHVDDDQLATSELCRVLKPGGWGILQSPIDYARQSTYEDATIIDPLERERHFGQDDHQRVFGLDYGERLLAAGFEVTESRWAGELTVDELARFGLDPREVIYFCQKPQQVAASKPADRLESTTLSVSEPVLS